MMESSGEILYGIGGLALVISALVARKLSLGEAAKMIFAWIAIFAVLFVIFSFRPEIKQIWDRVKSDFAGSANQNVAGSAVRLTRGDDGHFSVLAFVNGKPVTFMVDSGASVTSISSEVASEIGLEVDRSSYPVILSTANGSAKAWRANIKSIRVENITLNDHAIMVSDTLGNINLLGMNFLNELSSWRVERDTMVLEP
jgi:aspartyl protease family protein